MMRIQQDTETLIFQRRNPVTCEGLVQLTCGGPLPHYNGGLFVTRLRHFDPQQKRPGRAPGCRCVGYENNCGHDGTATGQP